MKRNFPVASAVGAKGSGRYLFMASAAVILFATGCASVRSAAFDLGTSVVFPIVLTNNKIAKSERIFGVTTVAGEHGSFDRPGRMNNGSVSGQVAGAPYQIPLSQVKQVWRERRRPNQAAIVANSFEELERLQLLEAWETVWITYLAEAQWVSGVTALQEEKDQAARFIGLEDASITLMMEEEGLVEFREDRVKQIRRKHRKFPVGTVIGGVAGLVLGSSLAKACASNSTAFIDVGCALPALAVAGAGLAAGHAADSAAAREVVYRAPERNAEVVGEQGVDSGRRLEVGQGGGR